MVENIWNEIWNKQVSNGLLLYQPKDETRWVVDRDWFNEVKAEGDRLNNQLEAIKTIMAVKRIIEDHVKESDNGSRVKITIEVSDKLYNELKIASERDGKTIEEFIPDVLFDIDVADME